MGLFDLIAAQKYFTHLNLDLLEKILILQESKDNPTKAL